jgi:hypothetical protein
MGSVESKTLFRFVVRRVAIGGRRWNDGPRVLELGAYEDGVGPLARVLGSYTF